MMGFPPRWLHEIDFGKDLVSGPGVEAPVPLAFEIETMNADRFARIFSQLKRAVTVLVTPSDFEPQRILFGEAGQGKTVARQMAVMIEELSESSMEIKQTRSVVYREMYRNADRPVADEDRAGFKLISDVLCNVLPEVSVKTATELITWYTDPLSSTRSQFSTIYFRPTESGLTFLGCLHCQELDLRIISVGLGELGLAFWKSADLLGKLVSVRLALVDPSDARGESVSPHVFYVGGLRRRESSRGLVDHIDATIRPTRLDNSDEQDVCSFSLEKERCGNLVMKKN